MNVLDPISKHVYFWGMVTHRRSRGPTKGERTRQRLFDIAVRRFQADGYEAASLRRIAGDAGVTPALLYRYFDSKEAIVAELYGRALTEWQQRAAAMPRGSWAERVIWLTRLAFEVLAPYRVLLRVLAGSMIAGDSTTSPIHNEASQDMARPTFARAVAEASDAPKDVPATADLAYAGHLGLILFWVMDQSPGQEATEKLMQQVAGLTPFLKLGLRMPLIGPRLRELGPLVMDGLRGTTA
jgi:AcrR family transcriptional regulator